jgi:hypothetical protein
MENLDFLILTSVVVIAFLIFGISTYMEFNKMNKDEFKNRGKSDGADKLMNSVGNVFDTNFTRKSD